MKYKNGDKVLVKKNLKDEDCKFGINDDMEKLGGKFVTIKQVIDDHYYIDEDQGEYKWDDGCFLYNRINNIDEIEKNDIITLRNGERLIFNNNDEFKDIEDDNDNSVISKNDFKDDLTNKEFAKEDIVKVERPILTTVYNRDEISTPIEMTLKEVCDKLGYEVKIIKED